MIGILCRKLLVDVVVPIAVAGITAWGAVRCAEIANQPDEPKDEDSDDEE